jgi:uncharacterized membrane protein
MKYYRDMTRDLLSVLVVPAAFILCSCTTDPVVGYRADIEPMLQQKCLECHLPPDGEGYVSTGLSLRTYDALMDGTMFGMVVIPGDSRRSVLNKLVEHRAGALKGMPPGTVKALTDEEIELFRLWVDQGAVFN